MVKVFLQLWESRYLHESYHLALNDNSDVITQPCPDVYSFPFMSKDFCEELIGEVEFFGQWSDGSNYVRLLEQYNFNFVGLLSYCVIIG